MSSGPVQQARRSGSTYAPAILVAHRQGLSHAAAMAAVLTKVGIPVHVWTLDPAVEDARMELEGVVRVVNLLHGFSRTAVSEVEYLDALSRLRDLEVKSGASFFHQDAALDRLLTGVSDVEVDFSEVRSRWTRQQVAVMAVHVFDAARREMAVEGPLVVVGETNSLPYRIIYHVARALDVPHLRPEIVSHSDGRMYFESALGSRWTRCRDLYDLFGLEGTPREAREWAEQKLAEILASRHQSAEFHTKLKGGPRLIGARLSPPNVWRSYREWRQALDPRFKNSPQGVDPGLLSPVMKARRSVRSIQRAQFYETVALRSIPKEQYACLFLHVQPEHTVECLAFEYQDQVALARNLAAALPADVLLLLKDHPLCGGRRSPTFYGEIRSIPGVELLHHSVETSEVIRGAALSATLTGTVALESVCWGVPCVVFGESYYRKFDGVYPGGSIESLRALFSHWPLASAAPEDRLRVLAARHTASLPCITDSGGLSWQDGGAVGRALIAELKARDLIGRSSYPEAGRRAE